MRRPRRNVPKSVFPVEYKCKPIPNIPIFNKFIVTRIRNLAANDKNNNECLKNFKFGIIYRAQDGNIFKCLMCPVA